MYKVTVPCADQTLTIEINVTSNVQQQVEMILEDEGLTGILDIDSVAQVIESLDSQRVKTCYDPFMMSELSLLKQTQVRVSPTSSMSQKPNEDFVKFQNTQEWQKLQKRASQALGLLFESKQLEINLLFSEQNNELQRAQSLNQTQKDVELIVQKHYELLSDWQTNSQQQIQQVRRQVSKDFWTSVHKTTFQPYVDLPQPYLQYKNIQLRTQFQVMPDPTYPTVLFCPALYDLTPEDSIERLTKFQQFYELTSIEGGWFIKHPIEGLSQEAENLYDPFLKQIKESLEHLNDAQFKNGADLLQDSDLFITRHSGSPWYNTICTAVTQTKTIKVVLSMVTKAIKTFTVYQAKLIINMDYILRLLPQEKHLKIVNKLACLLQKSEPIEIVIVQSDLSIKDHFK